MERLLHSSPREDLVYQRFQVQVSRSDVAQEFVPAADTREDGVHTCGTRRDSVWEKSKAGAKFAASRKPVMR